MAIVVNGTVNNLPASQLPTGYTPPVVTLISDYHYRYDVVIPLVWATTVTNVSPSVNMTAIVTATNTAVTALLALDFLATATVTAYSVINGLSNTNDVSNPNVLSSSVPQSLNVYTTIFVKTV